jgi:4-amino-4-deoxy-L-arabinose transferase-like glycosyltransferase
MTLPRFTVPRLIFLFGFIVLFLGTGHETGVTGKDEFWVTLRTPLEMMERGSYWTLWLNDEVRLQKPPLVYWFIAGMFHLVGVELWAARLVGVLSGAGMATLTTLLYRRLFKGSGFLAGIMLLATAGVAVEGRRAMLDMPLGLFTTWSVYLCVVAWQDKNRLAWAGAGAALAAATLAKGPQSLLFLLPALIMGLILLPKRPPARSLLVPALLLGVTFLALALPWPVSMRFLHYDFIEELNNQIVDQRLNRVSLRSPFNALGAILLLTFPWSFVTFTGLILAWKKGHALCDRRVQWLAGWLMLSVLPFFFMRSFERYMIPILPCAALLILVTLERVSPRTRKILVILSALLLAIVALVFSLFGMWFDLTYFSSMATVGMTLWLLWTACTEIHPQRPVIAAVWVFTFILGILYPRLGVNRLPDNLPWDDLKASRVGIYSSYSQPAMLSMRLGRSVEFPFEDRLNTYGFDGFIFTTRDQYRDPARVDTLHHALRTAGIPYEEAGSYPVFFSRRTWIRFTDPEADRETWRTALRTRNLTPLKSEIVFVRTHPE